MTIRGNLAMCAREASDQPSPYSTDPFPSLSSALTFSLSFFLFHLISPSYFTRSLPVSTPATALSHHPEEKQIKIVSSSAHTCLQRWNSIHFRQGISLAHQKACFVDWLCGNCERNGVTWDEHLETGTSISQEERGPQRQETLSCSTFRGKKKGGGTATA